MKIDIDSIEPVGQPAGLHPPRALLDFSPDFIDLLPVAAYACDASGRVLWFNRRAADLWGRAPRIGDDTELFCGSYRLYFDGRQIGRAETPMAVALRSGEAIHGAEGIVERPDGSRTWTTVHIDPVKDAAGEVLGAINCFSDTTAEPNRIPQQDHQSLAAELEAVRHLQQVSTLLIEPDENQLLHDRILDAATTALRADFASIQLLDPDHGADGALKLLCHRGFSAEAARFWEWVSPASQSVCGMALRTRQRVAVPDVQNCDFMAGSSDLEICINTGIRAVQTTPLLSRSGVLLGMLSTHWREPHDLTAAESRFLDILARLAADLIERVQTKNALREREEDFHLFVNNVREYALVQTDAGGRVTSWNPGAERLFGYRRADAVGVDFATLAAVGGNAASPPVADSGIPAHDDPPETAGWMARNDGGRFWARWITEPVYDETGSIRGTAWIIRNETARRRTETAIHDSLTKKNELLKDIHHRIKNNLQIIISLMNLQSGRIEDRRLLEPFDETRNRVQSIASTYELLYRSDTFAAVDVTEYTRRLVKNIVCFYAVREWMETEVNGDDITLEPDRAVSFGLLLNELVSNVCKHAFPDRKNGKLTITLHCDEGHIMLTVADNGIGLPKDFDYFRVSSLGLQLVHSLARQLRANIEIQVEDGTRVIVGLPQRIKED